MKNLWIASLVAVTGMLTTSVAQASPEIVGLKLSLVIDVSGSVSSPEYNLQMDGYRDAFLNSTVKSNIISNTNGIAVNVVFFGSNSVVNPFFHLYDNATITNFANYLDTLARPFTGNTNIVAGMNSARTSLLNETSFKSSRLTMDVSGDGEHNTGGGTAAVEAARDAAAAAGITVNGLAIGGTSLLNYYTNNVITGTNSFAVQANDFNAFRDAVLQKIEAETRPQEVPEPGSMAIFAGMALVVGFSRLRGRNQNMMVV